uniref:WD_REPEATS_REGION domain-containing protein n=1 Tax=Angiostrongylus cantonensis TaxID=6313 RepID=A0A0K0DFT7_ANGCA
MCVSQGAFNYCATRTLELRTFRFLSNLKTLQYLMYLSFFLDENFFLQAHEACVNTLRWNRGGTLLASGSDDRRIKVWNLAGDCLTSVDTGHLANVFAVEFLPAGKSATCEPVFVISSRIEPITWKTGGRVKRLATAQDEPYLFWSAAEDSHVRFFSCTTSSYCSMLTSTKALLLYPGNSKALWRLTRSLMLLEQWELARECIKLFKKRFPNDRSIIRLADQVSFANVLDYSERFCGQTNTHTDIKEANFFGSRNQYIVAGSDCGSLLLWERSSGVLVAAWNADQTILNIVQPHPLQFMLATSGIEEVIRFWEPTEEGKECGQRLIFVAIFYFFVAYFPTEVLHMTNLEPVNRDDTWRVPK